MKQKVSTLSNSLKSTSPSPFRSNILKAISKCLIGAVRDTEKKIVISIMHTYCTYTVFSTDENHFTVFLLCVCVCVCVCARVCVCELLTNEKGYE